MTTFDPHTLHSTHPNYVRQQFQAPQYGAPQYGAQGFAGQQFPGPVPPPGSPPSRKRPLVGKLIAGLVAAGLVVGGAGTWMTLSGSSAEAATQTTSFAGANPTTSPFGTDAPQVATVAATGPQAGDTPGMFAATTPPSCNNAAFLSQLQADPAKLAAFGGVFGIGAGDVPAFVNSLSPVVLRAASSVTDHPFTNGAFVGQPAVLAAGTAVLVNSYGEPTVKCFNGNPLTAGASTAGAVTIIPTDRVISQFRFTTLDNTRIVVIPGQPDPKPNPGPNPGPGTGAGTGTGTGTQPGGGVLGGDPPGSHCDPVACREPGGANPGGGNPTDPAAVKAATQARADAESAATAARIAARGLSDDKQQVEQLQTQINKQAQIANDPLQLPNVRQAAQAQLNLLGTQFNEAIKTAQADATALDKANADAEKTDATAREAESKAGVPSKPPFVPEEGPKGGILNGPQDGPQQVAGQDTQASTTATGTGPTTGTGTTRHRHGYDRHDRCRHDRHWPDDRHRHGRHRHDRHRHDRHRHGRHRDDRDDRHHRHRHNRDDRARPGRPAAAPAADPSSPAGPVPESSGAGPAVVRAASPAGSCAPGPGSFTRESV